MNVRVPTPVQNILSDYISNFQKQIPHTLEALYLHGSIALKLTLKALVILIL